MKNCSLKWFEQINNYIEYIEVDFINCIPVGRAKSLVTKTYKPLCSNGLSCRGCTSLSVTIEGDIYPCNSVTITSTDLKIGNIFRDNVEQSLDHAYRNGILNLLRNKGFDYFIDIAKKVHIEIPDRVFSESNIAKLKPYIILELLRQRR